MASEKFRYQLRQEAKAWHEEGLITPEIHQQLVARYSLADLDSTSRDRFVGIVLGVGFVLLGLGVITFVAANWQAWSRPIKVILLLSLFIGTNYAGFSLWRSPGNSVNSRLGLGLLLLGGLSLGANLGLMSQMFHQTGSVYTLFLIWGLAICAMAWGLRLMSLGLMAILLVIIAYCSGFASFMGSDQVFSQAIQQIPLIIGLLFIPLAYYCRSRWIFGLSAILLTFALEFNLIFFTALAQDSGDSRWFQILMIVVLLVFPAALLWSYQDTLFFRNQNLRFAGINRRLAIFYLSSLFYLGSFRFPWGDPRLTSSAEPLNWQHWSLMVAPIIFAIFTLWGWWKLGLRRDTGLPWRLERNSTYVASVLLCLLVLVIVHGAVTPLGMVGTMIFNLLLALLAIILISQSIQEGQRLSFWMGIVLLILQIFSRMIEYDTGLILKAIALFGCGLAAIMAGLWFEKNLTSAN